MNLLDPQTRAARWATLLFALVAAACGDDGTAPEDRVVAGVDLDVLFAPPTQAEIDAVANDWAGRDPVASQIQVVATGAVSILGIIPHTVTVVSHDVGGVLHYGAFVVPDGADPASLPIVVYLHGGDAGFAVNDVVTIAQFAADLAGNVVWVAPSFRAEALRFDGQTFTSGGPPSPWDRDVDDALALLDVALTTVPEIDPTRIGLLGLSRGAGVALLMAEREPSIDGVVEFFGPTDFFGEFVQDVTEEALLGTLRNLPGLEFLDGEFITPLRLGATTIPAVRGELVRRSAVLFADRLPDAQVHHGEADMVVEVSQAESLIRTMSGLGRMAPEFEAFLYPNGGHNPLTMDGSIPRTQDFLVGLLGLP
ncbi:MAG: peptidase [Gemmatimonadota bacterium]